jgi:carbon monoxide dehydrogenase subunit G
MQLAGEAQVGAPPETVWAALTDPDFLARLIPGCEEMTGDPARGYDIRASRGVGALTVRLTGRIDLHDVEPGRGCRLVASGDGGAAGSARGSARIRLTPEGPGTRLGWEIDAEVAGRLAALPGPILGFAARQVADRFVERFTAAIEGRKPTAGWLSRLKGK